MALILPASSGSGYASSPMSPTVVLPQRIASAQAAMSAAPGVPGLIGAGMALLKPIRPLVINFVGGATGGTSTSAIPGLFQAFQAGAQRVIASRGPPENFPAGVDYK